jgi:hypothetical protein
MKKQVDAPASLPPALLVGDAQVVTRATRETESGWDPYEVWRTRIKDVQSQLPPRAVKDNPEE